MQKKAISLILIITLLSVFFSLPAMASSTRNCIAYGKVSNVDTAVNVRSGPGTSYSLIGKWALNTSFHVFSKTKASDGYYWYGVARATDGAVGYIRESYVTLDQTFTGDLDVMSKLPSVPEDFNSDVDYYLVAAYYNGVYDRIWLIQSSGFYSVRVTGVVGYSSFLASNQWTNVWYTDYNGSYWSKWKSQNTATSGALSNCTSLDYSASVNMVGIYYYPIKLLVNGMQADFYKYCYDLKTFNRFTDDGNARYMLCTSKASIPYTTVSPSGSGFATSGASGSEPYIISANNLDAFTVLGTNYKGEVDEPWYQFIIDFFTSLVNRALSPFLRIIEIFSNPVGSGWEALKNFFVDCVNLVLIGDEGDVEILWNKICDRYASLPFISDTVDFFTEFFRLFTARPTSADLKITLPAGLFGSEQQGTYSVLNLSFFQYVKPYSDILITVLFYACFAKNFLKKAGALFA